MPSRASREAPMRGFFLRPVVRTCGHLQTCSFPRAPEAARRKKIAENPAMRAIACPRIRARTEFGQTWSGMSSRRSRSALGLDARNQLLRLRQDTPDDDINAGRRGMDTVALVERAISNDTVEEERVENYAICRCQMGERGIERAYIVRPHVPRRVHAGKQHGDTALMQPTQNPVEGRARSVGVDAAQPVVGAERQDHGLGPA